jgi:hypothetical protein
MNEDQRVRLRFGTLNHITGVSLKDIPAMTVEKPRTGRNPRTFVDRSFVPQVPRHKYSYRAPASLCWIGCQGCGKLSRKSFMARKTLCFVGTEDVVICAGPTDHLS